MISPRPDIVQGCVASEFRPSALRLRVSGQRLNAKVSNMNDSSYNSIQNFISLCLFKFRHFLPSVKMASTEKSESTDGLPQINCQV